jgi:hypothetical protein
MRRLMRLEQRLGFVPVLTCTAVAIRKPEISAGHHTYFGHASLKARASLSAR